MIWAERLPDCGTAAECVRLGNLYAAGGSVPKDAAAALALYERACQLEDARACRVVGNEHRGPELEKPRDAGRALAFLWRACDLGDGLGCWTAAWMLDRGLGAPKDPGRALPLHERGCNLGIGGACTDLGLAHERGRDLRRDLARANALYLRGCELGNPPGCTNLAVNLRDGLGIERDVARAAGLYKKACDMEDGDGCNGLGRLHQRGKGVPLDLTRASALYEQACALGNSWGCTNLARYLTSGRAIPRDPERAAMLLGKACELENATGCLELGLAHGGAEGVAIDRSKAAFLYDRACALGSGTGCLFAGFARELGRGVPRDLGGADAAFQKACELGEAEGCGRKAIARELGADGNRDPEDFAAEFCVLDAAACHREKDPVRRSRIRARARRSFVAGCEGGDIAACQRLVSLLDENDEPDAASVGALAAFAGRHPARLGEIDGGRLLRAVRTTALHLHGSQGHQLLLEALFEAGWEPRDVSDAWADLVRLRVARGQAAGALQALERVRDPYALVALRVDRRVAGLVREHPERFDVDRARSRWIEHRRAGGRDAPRSLLAQILLAEALSQGLQQDEALEVLRVALERAQSVANRQEDADRMGPWALAARGVVLSRLGRWSEALEAAEQARGRGDKSTGLTLRYALLLCELARPAEALATIEGVEALIPAYRARTARIRLLAALEQGDAAARMGALAELRRHENTVVGDLQDGLLAAGELEEAARLLVRRLADEGLRADALLEVQEFEEGPPTPRMKEWAEHRRQLLDRPEVRAAIAKVGVVERHPLAR